MKIVKYNDDCVAPLKCVVTISIEKWGGFIIEDLKLFEQAGRKWFHFPSKYSKDESKHFEYNHFDSRSMRNEFHKLLFTTVNNYKLKKQREQTLNDTPDIKTQIRR